MYFVHGTSLIISFFLHSILEDLLLRLLLKRHSISWQLKGKNCPYDGENPKENKTQFKQQELVLHYLKFQGCLVSKIFVKTLCTYCRVKEPFKGFKKDISQIAVEKTILLKCFVKVTSYYISIQIFQELPNRPCWIACNFYIALLYDGFLSWPSITHDQFTWGKWETSRDVSYRLFDPIARYGIIHKLRLKQRGRVMEWQHY